MEITSEDIDTTVKDVEQGMSFLKLVRDTSYYHSENSMD